MGLRSPSRRVFRVLEHQYPRPLAQHRSAAACIERATRRLALVRYGEEPRYAEVLDHIALQRALGTAGDHDIRHPGTDLLERLTDGARRGHTACRNVQHGSAQAVAMG